MNSRLAIKTALTLMTIYYVYIPTSADIGDSHLHNEEWSDHARVHLVWFLAFTALIATISVVWMWMQDAPLMNVLIGLSFNGAFLFAAAIASSYDCLLYTSPSPRDRG